MKAEAQNTMVTPAATTGRMRFTPRSCSRTELRTSKRFFMNLQSRCTIAGMLDVHRLRVFRAVVASGSVHAAATHLGYTASAVSQHVSALQRETGLVLM